MIDLTPIFNLLIAVLAAVAARYLIPWLSANTTARQRENMLAWAKVAVAAAQQLYHQFDGEQRLQYALSLMEEQGFDIETSIVRDAIESEVLKLHQQLDGDGRV